MGAFLPFADAAKPVDSSQLARKSAAASRQPGSAWNGTTLVVLFDLLAQSNTTTVGPAGASVRSAAPLLLVMVAVPASKFSLISFPLQTFAMISLPAL